jgi:hypothetical protein
VAVVAPPAATASSLERRGVRDDRLEYVRLEYVRLEYLGLEYVRLEYVRLEHLWLEYVRLEYVRPGLRRSRGNGAHTPSLSARYHTFVRRVRSAGRISWSETVGSQLLVQLTEAMVLSAQRRASR